MDEYYLLWTIFFWPVLVPHFFGQKMSNNLLARSKMLQFSKFITSLEPYLSFPIWFFSYHRGVPQEGQKYPQNTHFCKKCKQVDSVPKYVLIVKVYTSLEPCGWILGFSIWFFRTPSWFGRFCPFWSFSGGCAVSHIFLLYYFKIILGETFHAGLVSRKILKYNDNILFRCLLWKILNFW